MQRLLFALAMLATSTFAADGPVIHVVHFKFKKDATAEQIRKVTDSFSALKGKISEIESLDWGTDSSPEGLSKGFTHVWIVKFKDARARDAYLIHPEHKAFVGVLGPILDEPLVVDFIPQK